MEKTAEVFC